jgi:hypothetical protein
MIAERLFMSDIYVMQRANGDVFALEDHGRFRVPLFNSTTSNHHRHWPTCSNHSAIS